MKKFVIQAILLLFVTAGALLLFNQNLSLQGLPFIPQPTAAKQIQVGNTVFNVEVADTQAKRNKGLSGRQPLGQSEGMLFVFEKADKPTFWMKGLSFPLDFIWIREDKVVDLTQNALPPVSGQTDTSLPFYSPKEDIDKVLEVNGGTAQRLNIKIGDTVKVI